MERNHEKGEQNMGYPQEKEYTVEDIDALPEGIHAELIDGQIHYMASPTTLHQRIAMRMAVIATNYIDAHDGGCEVLGFNTGVFINRDDRNYLEPDLMIVCDRDQMDDRGYHGGPDFIVEIISPSTQGRDYGIKLLKYRTAGVREYWIINPETKTTLVYFFEDEERNNQYSFWEDIPVSILPGLTININGILAYYHYEIPDHV